MKMKLLKHCDWNYKEMAKILSDSGVDILILEMLVDIDHSKILLNAALETGLPVWVGLSCCINKYDDNVVGRNYNVEKVESLIFDKINAALQEISPDNFAGGISIVKESNFLGILIFFSLSIIIRILLILFK